MPMTVTMDGCFLVGPRGFKGTIYAEKYLGKFHTLEYLFWPFKRLYGAK